MNQLSLARWRKCTSYQCRVSRYSCSSDWLGRSQSQPVTETLSLNAKCWICNLQPMSVLKLESVNLWLSTIAISNRSTIGILHLNGATRAIIPQQSRIMMPRRFWSQLWWTVNGVCLRLQKLQNNCSMGLYLECLWVDCRVALLCHEAAWPWARVPLWMTQ